MAIATVRRRTMTRTPFAADPTEGAGGPPLGREHAAPTSVEQGSGLPAEVRRRPLVRLSGENQITGPTPPLRPRPVAAREPLAAALAGLDHEGHQAAAFRGSTIPVERSERIVRNARHRGPM